MIEEQTRGEKEKAIGKGQPETEISPKFGGNELYVPIQQLEKWFSTQFIHSVVSLKKREINQAGA